LSDLLVAVQTRILWIRFQTVDRKISDLKARGASAIVSSVHGPSLLSSESVRHVTCGKEGNQIAVVRFDLFPKCARGLLGARD